MINMENLFGEKKWKRDNIKLYKGMLFVNLSGERWVLLDDCINRISILLGSEKLAAQCDDGTFYYTIEDDNILVRSKEDSDYKRTITYYELFEITYSDWWNSDLEVSHKKLANALNVATLYNERPIVNLFNNRLWNISNNVVILEGIMFINVTGDRWYPIADNVSGGFSHNPGEFIFTPNNCGLSRLISVNTKYKTLDIFSLFFNTERNHEYSITQPLLVKLGQDVVKGKNWNDYHDLLLEELNRYNSSVRLFANNKVEYESYEDDWGEPEKEESKEGFTELWSKVRKGILGIKTPSERFEETIESAKVFHDNLHEALKAHLNHDLIKEHLEKKDKTLNDLRKEYNFNDVQTRPLNIDAEIYSWLAHFDEEGNLKIDKVNSPDHYKLRGLDIEAIDVIRGALTEDEFRGFCKGNVLKYTIREGHKNGDEDLKKAKKYLEFLEEDE